MAKQTAPLLSFGASGTIAKAVVHARWRGISYARKWVTPANPNTVAQQSTRGAFTFLTQVWKNMPSLVQAAWTLEAKGQPMTDRNIWISSNLASLRGQTANLGNFTFMNGAKGGLSLTSATPTGGSGSISMAYVAPTPPTDWTLTDVIVAAQLSIDPTMDPVPVTHAAEGASTPVVLSGLAAGSYVVGAFAVWTKPDLSLAYGPAIMHATAVTVS